MKPFFLSDYGNPASITHGFGWRALEAVNEARLEIARAINAHPTEIIFTSGATESTNMAIKGLFFPESLTTRRELISSSIEHPATLSSIRALAPAGLSGIFIKPEPDGVVELARINDVLSEKTAMLSLFFVNNEVGSINDIKNISQLARKHGVYFHCDAAQALGRVKIDCQELGVDMMSLSGHKIYGPKGVGVLYMRREVMERICPLIHGGGQEWGKRSGTLNVTGIVGMGEAARLADSHLDKEVLKIKDLRDRLWQNLQVLPDMHLNGSLRNRVAGNLNVSFAGIDGEELVLGICERVAISTGSACSSGHSSKVLQEIGVIPELRQAAIRFGIGRSNSREEIDEVAELVVSEVKKLRLKYKKKLVKLV